MHKYNCINCSKEFFSREKNKKYCSRKCYIVFRRESSRYNCLNCGKERFAGRKTKFPKFCSVRCYKSYVALHGRPGAKGRNYPIKNCVLCGSEFKRKCLTQKFCSRRCASLSLSVRAKTTKHSIKRSEKIPGYKEWRAAVFLRDNFTCQLCKVRGTYLEAHRIYKFSSYTNVRLLVPNGITLCKNCHSLTKGKEEKFAPLFKMMTGIEISAFSNTELLYVFYNDDDLGENKLELKQNTIFYDEENPEESLIAIDVSTFMSLFGTGVNFETNNPAD